jgi:hypothetical protein
VLQGGASCSDAVCCQWSVSFVSWSLTLHFVRSHNDARTASCSQHLRLPERHKQNNTWPSTLKTGHTHTHVHTHSLAHTRDFAGVMQDTNWPRRVRSSPSTLMSFWPTWCGVCGCGCGSVGICHVHSYQHMPAVLNARLLPPPLHVPHHTHASPPPPPFM